MKDLCKEIKDAVSTEVKALATPARGNIYQGFNAVSIIMNTLAKKKVRCNLHDLEVNNDFTDSVLKALGLSLKLTVKASYDGEPSSYTIVSE